MQLLLILGIVFAIGAVTFALQNNVAVTVVFAFWRYDSSLAVVLLVALALGVLIAAYANSNQSCHRKPLHLCRQRRAPRPTSV
jgi:putative membrane protein